MEETKKKPSAISRMPAGFLGLPKPVMIGIAVVCIVLAVGITIMRSSGGGRSIEGLPRGTMIWVKCANPDCGDEYQIDRVDYLLFMKEHEDEMDYGDEEVAVPMVCEKCGKRSVYKAIKCEKCGEVFFAGVTGGFEDKCPECGFSKIEDMRKRARAAGQR